MGPAAARGSGEMDPAQKVAEAAALDLARTLAGGRERRAGRVAETAMRTPGREQGSLPDPGALAGLARAVVDAVLGMAGRRVDPDELAGVVRRAARNHLMTMPAGSEALVARLAAETPRLLNLPRLVELAASGLAVGPAAAAGAGDEPGSELVAGESPAFMRVLEDLERVAATDFSVVLYGESGTGKEMLARRLHRLSPRSGGPMVALNCAALAPALLESELFGHSKGAFTGADAEKPGYIAAANGGTLFLDEIGETSAEFQVRLLRVLEDRVVVPVGRHSGRAADFRLVCASSSDLGELAGRGRFNRALLYRIEVVPLRLPPLRQRREDLPALIDHLLAQACLLAKRSRRLSQEARQALMDYDWPGNVRQLSHTLQRMVALSDEYEIGPELLPAELRAGRSTGLEEMERRLAGCGQVPQKHLRPLAELLARAPEEGLANKDVRASLDCSDSTAKNLLGALVRAGLLSAQGRRGGRRYLVCAEKED